MLLKPFGKRPSALSLAISFISTISFAAHAEQIETVLVTGKKLEESIPLKLEKYGNQVEIISGESIRNGNFVDATDALKNLVPGLFIAPKSGPFDYFKASLQGSRNKDILWLLDGVRINNRLYNNTSPLDTIPSHMIERIEVLKGGQGIFYGTQSVGGVINIITKTLTDESDGALGFGVHSNGGHHLNAYIRRGSEQHQFVIYASRDYADSYEPYAKKDFQPSATDRKRNYDVKNIGLKYGWQVTENLMLSLHHQTTQNQLDYLRVSSNRFTVNKREENLTTIKLEGQLSNSVSLYFKAYRHSWETDYTRIYNELNAGQLTGGVIVRNDKTYWGYKDFGFNTLLEFSPNDYFTYALGLDQQNYKAKDDVWRIADQNERVNAIFGQIRTGEALFENTLLAFGVRNNRPSTAEDSTVWNFSGKHDFSDNWYVQTNIGTSFRLPDAESLFLKEYDDLNNDGIPDSAGFSIGNPDLKAEKSENIHVSLGAKFQRFEFELTGFKRDISDYIDSYVPTTIAGLAGDSFKNSDKEVNIIGHELTTQFVLSENVKTGFSYTHTLARFNDKGRQLNHIPKKQAKINLDYEPSDSSWGSSLNLNYVGRVNDRTVRDSYIVADVAGFFAFGSNKQQRITMRLENIADADYATGIGRATRDSGGRYLYENKGVGRTLHMSYQYQF